VEFWYFEKDIIKMTRNVLDRPDSEKPIADHLLINGRNFDVYDIPSHPAPVILTIHSPTPYAVQAQILIDRLSQAYWGMVLAVPPLEPGH
jgi:hypothetical protein